MKQQQKRDRRPLVDGLKPVDPAVERHFVHAGNAKTDEGAVLPSSEERKGKGQKGSTTSRVPLTTRLRADFSEALTQAMLHRKLNKEFPNTLQEMLEEALEPWLRAKGYLK